MGTIAPEGIYEARCSAVGIQQTNSGKDYVSADFEVEDGDDLYMVEWRGWLTEKTETRTLESLRLMGWTGDDVYGDLVADGAMRNKVKLDVRHEEYKDKVTARVAFINGPDPDPVATEKKREAMRERLRRKAKAIPVVAPSKEEDEDKLPF